MGNIALCAPSIFYRGVVKVLFADGRVRMYAGPVKAAELMLENPGEFVCAYRHLKVGSRIGGLSAEEVLEPRQLYLLLPMEMLYSVLTSEEMCSLNETASKALKQGSLNFTKIFPVLGDFCLFPSSEARLVDSSSSTDPVDRYSKQRSWKPALDTIIETPPHT